MVDFIPGPMWIALGLVGTVEAGPAAAVAGLLAGEASKDYVSPFIIYSPATIFSNDIPAFDVNFINPDVKYKGGTLNFDSAKIVDGKLEGVEYKANGDGSEYEDDGKTIKGNTASHLRETIATWYVALRNIAIVGLLSVLLYIAIRIIISSTAGETAKYKSMIKDWLVAMCLLFVLHYIMAFILKSADMITDLFDDTVITTTAENGEQDDTLKMDAFMNNARTQAEYAMQEEDGEYEADKIARFGYAFIYAVLVWYTLIFTVKYLKRVIYVAFLTMISPLVALTYPIDKVKDGSAQAFNMWFKEYFYNVMIQPIDLILYAILITSAQSFAEDNLIYTIVALGFLMEAEKIVRSMFGFNKASGGVLSSAITGGAIFGSVAGLVQKGAGMLPGGKGSSGSSKSENGKVRFNDRQADSGATSNLGAFATGAAGGVRTLATSTGGASESSGDIHTPKDRATLDESREKINRMAKALNNSASSSSNDNRETELNSSNGISANIGDGTHPSASNGISANIGDGTHPSASNGNLTDAIRNRARNEGIRDPRVRKSIKGVSNVAGRFVNKDNAKKALKLAAMGIGAATLGTIGVAAGVASDNDKDVLTYGALGAGAGSFAASRLSNLSDSASSLASNVKDDFQQGYYGEDYEDKVLNPKLDKEWMKDRNVKQHFKQKYGDSYKDKMKDALQLRKAGITDQSDIDTAIKLMDKNQGLSVDQAANIMQFSKDISKADVMKDREKVVKAAKNFVNDDAQAEKITKLVEQRYKLRK
jgi:predicted DNA-binding protein (UPF0251 family)